jgi:antitoxin component YwqK of YwqJK toxin-antitoxin module
LKKLFLLSTILLTVFACKQKEENHLSNPLVIRNGLFYEDSTSAKPFTGRHKSRMRDMIIEYEVVNGLREGDFIIYFSNAKIQMEGKMKNNKNNGLWKYYYPDGSLQTSGNYNLDIPDSIWKWYYNNGKVSEEGKFRNGVRDGEWKSYDSTGKLEIIRSYKDDKLIDSTKVG